MSTQQHAFTQLLAAWRRRDAARGDRRERVAAHIQHDVAQARTRSTLDPLR